MTAPVLSMLPPNQAPEVFGSNPTEFAIIGRRAMQGIVKSELIKMASFWSFSFPFNEFLIAVAAEEPQITVQPVRIIDCLGRSLKNLTHMYEKEINRIGVSIQATKID